MDSLITHKIEFLRNSDKIFYSVDDLIIWLERIGHKDVSEILSNLKEKDKE